MTNQLKTYPLKDWGHDIQNPLIIAGPCSVETAEQLDKTVEGLAKQGVKIIRAGVWKPRTRPNTFEGVGSIAFPWIQEAKEKYKVKFAVEVASPAHVEEALKNNIDLLWIGARSTANPFTVQDIADSLKGVDIPVLIKNPINPDLALWIGALERIHQAGITKIGAIHRGFSNFNDTHFRNSPMWQIPIEFKTRFPDIPLINDPSHICGKRALIPQVAQMALDLNFDGLMIESHFHPDSAWSDAEQQLRPEDLGLLLASLKTRQVFVDDLAFASQLQSIREQIDDTDREILELLSRRMGLVEKVGEYKKINNVAVFQIERWKKVFQTRPEWATALNLNPEFVKELYKMIHTESIKKQTEVMERHLS
ncbi:bifunctional 3-deoxy-7-phosphoheptulonate synthase/chorismate mutase type II [Rhodonellum sp.]|uniref:bifunctional 3-deoxy-7-phosphoheptulonate synthase/chorismate mutase type II n=1 Tax=Rhodonellum sp. TaxID=2231180 RepID=UPI00271DBBD3|nr:bifunctional 3-deoxy-7-phosphoheptulonate synthase/chorismate mutase type II [Rhodonellum sp.]MDO9554583.1 bifunctional 3-deoxy-7-phosphoheptulonate synthase/chorismate mutase type II [Rhodonellum sp.]